MSDSADTKRLFSVDPADVAERDRQRDIAYAQYIEITKARSKGLGDTIAKITHATGLDKLSETYTKITGRPCGCTSRQEALNKLFPYGVVEEGK